MLHTALKARRLNWDPSQLDEDQLKRYERCMNEIVLAICSGRIEIGDATDANAIIFKPQSLSNERIVYKQPTGETYMAGDGAEGVTRLVKMSMQLTKKPEAIFRNLDREDFRVVTALVPLFLD